MKKISSIVLILGALFSATEWMAGSSAAKPKGSSGDGELNILCDRVCNSAGCTSVNIYKTCMKTCEPIKDGFAGRADSLKECQKTGATAEKNAPNAGMEERAIKAVCTGVSCKDKIVKKLCQDTFTAYEKLGDEEFNPDDGTFQIKNKGKTLIFGQKKMSRKDPAFQACENAK